MTLTLEGVAELVDGVPDTVALLPRRPRVILTPGPGAEGWARPNRPNFGPVGGDLLPASLGGLARLFTRGHKEE